MWSGFMFVELSNKAEHSGGMVACKVLPSQLPLHGMSVHAHKLSYVRDMKYQVPYVGT